MTKIKNGIYLQRVEIKGETLFWRVERHGREWEAKLYRNYTDYETSQVLCVETAATLTYLNAKMIEREAVLEQKGGMP